MNRLYLLCCLGLSASGLNAQFSIDWQKCLGGNYFEAPYSIQHTTDGGYILAGFAIVNNGDIQGVMGGGDFWVIKLDSVGELMWQKPLGGTSLESANSIQQTFDGGYIVAGKTDSNDGDVSGYHGATDCWVVKLNATGNIEWQKALGGSSSDEAYCIQQTSDGGYIVAGKSGSLDGDVTGNHGYFDYWIVKLDAFGNIIWQKSIGGGNGADKAYCIRQTSDGGYIIAGESNSSNGDVSGNHGGGDFWIVKLNDIGAIEWQKALGGIGIDVARWVSQTADGGYIAIGEAGSGNTGQVTGNHGGFDMWLVKLSDTGALQWQKSFGGTNEDYGTSVEPLGSQGYLVTGTTISNNGDVSQNDGGVDIWALTLNKTGEILSQITLGGTKSEYCHAMALTVDGGVAIAGVTGSNNGDVSGFLGNQDFWVVKLSLGTTSLTTSPNTPNLNIYPNPANGQIYIQLPEGAETLSISIQDQLGRVILRQTGTLSDGVDISSLPNGVYLVQASTDDGLVRVGKFVKVE